MAIRTETIVTRYEVVTINHEQGVDRIKQKQQQLALQMKDWNESAKETERVHAQAWKTVGLSIAAAGVAILGARSAFQHYAKEQQLAANVGTVSLDRLAKAAGGTRTQLELMSFAAAANTGSFKLSTAQMEIAVGAMRQLVREGKDQEAVTQKVTEALVKLEGDGLKDFGVRVREATSDTDKFAAIMEALAAKAKLVDGQAADSTESIQGLGVRFEDTFNRIKTSIGEMVVAMAPLIQGAAELAEAGAGLTGKTVQGWSMIGAVMSGNRDEFFRLAGQGSEAEYKREDYGNAYQEIVALGGNPFAQVALREARRGASVAAGANAERWMRQNEWVANNRDAEIEIEGQRRGGRPRERVFDWARGRAGAARDNLDGALGAEYLPSWMQGIDFAAMAEMFELQQQLALNSNASDVRGQEESLAASIAKARDALAAFEEIATAEDRYTAFRTEKTTTKLEQIFGPVDQFDAYATAFQTLTGAVGAAYDAWIDGSLGAGAAAKKFLGDSIAATGKLMAIEALKETAYALAFAFVNPAKAATHAAAAVAFGVGAAAAGIAAKELGGGGAAVSAGGGGGTAPALSPGAGNGGVEGKSTVVVVGNSFARESPRQRQRLAEQQVNEALGTSAGRPG